jgi:hypothetical protein
MSASFSPDGRWVAYDSDESGRHQIYVQGFPERRRKWSVSPDTGSNPEWRADGKELYWVARDFILTAAAVELQAAAVRPERAEALFKLRGIHRPARDGRRILVSEPEGACGLANGGGSELGSEVGEIGLRDPSHFWPAHRDTVSNCFAHTPWLRFRMLTG